MKAGLFTAAALALCVSICDAQESYVDAVNGDDANGGSSWDDAWRTLTHATTASGYQATIHVAPGLYDAALGESFPLGLGYRTFLGAGPQATILDGGGAGSLFEDYLISDGALRVEGLCLRDAARGVRITIDGLFGEATLVVTVRDVCIEGMSLSGIDAGASTGWYDAWMDLRVERARFQDCERGISCWSDASDPQHPTTPPDAYAELLCTDSLFAGNVRGITGGADAGDTGLRIERCTIADSVEQGVWAGTFVQAVVESTILAGNGTDVAGDVTLAWSCTQRGPAPGPGNVAGDPLFNDPANGDWRPRFGSPCVDAAEPVPAPDDLAGRPRTADGDLDLESRADMGAFELEPLTARTEAVVGAPLELELWGPVGGATTVLAVRGPLARRRWTPFGWSRLAPPWRELGPLAVAPGPPAVLALPLPDDASLIGQTLSFQALTDSADAPAGQAWTNALELTVLP